MLVSMVKTIVQSYPSWSLNDILNTDIKYLNQILFTDPPKKKKQKVVKPLSDLVKGVG